jgi:hypothetical protein
MKFSFQDWQHLLYGPLFIHSVPFIRRSLGAFFTDFASENLSSNSYEGSSSIHRKRASSMQYNMFYQAVSRDFVPHGRRCEWCGQPAVQQLTALGGLHHNQSGCFCLTCGRVFIRIVTESTSGTERSQLPSQASSIVCSTAPGRRISMPKIPAQIG